MSDSYGTWSAPYAAHSYETSYYTPYIAYPAQEEYVDYSQVPIDSILPTPTEVYFSTQYSTEYSVGDGGYAEQYWSQQNPYATYEHFDFAARRSHSGPVPTRRAQPRKQRSSLNKTVQGVKRAPNMRRSRSDYDCVGETRSANKGAKYNDKFDKTGGKSADMVLKSDDWDRCTKCKKLSWVHPTVVNCAGMPTAKILKVINAIQTARGPHCILRAINCEAVKQQLLAELPNYIADESDGVVELKRDCEFDSWCSRVKPLKTVFAKDTPTWWL
jgi:hypothetical protein